MKVFIRFIADRSFISRAIGWRTDGKPSHVEYVYIPDEIFGMPEAPVTLGARLEGGVQFRPINYCSPTFEEWYTFEGIEESYKQAVKFVGRKYDWKDIVELATGIYPTYYNPDRAICSILVGYSNRLAWAAGKAPVLINPNVPTRQMTPQLLYGAVTVQVPVGGN